MPELIGVLSLDDFRLIFSLNSTVKKTFSTLEETYLKSYPELKQENIKFSDISNDNLAVISYTQGQPAFQKG